MEHTELHIITTSQHTSQLADQLLLLGAAAITLRDQGNQPIYQHLHETIQLWDETLLIALFEHETSLDPIINFLHVQQANGTLSQYEIKPLADQDWVRNSLQSFSPIQVGKDLCICPSWLTDSFAFSGTTVILDPGLAFGTGNHATTLLCLEWLAENHTPQQTVIDYGCGSGILAITAAKLGAAYVYAIDNDPQALLATNENIERNKLSNNIISVHSPATANLPLADSLIANILAAPLITLAATLANLVKSGGFIVLSGLLIEQATAVALAYEPWFIMQPAVFKGEWARITGERK